MLSLFWKHLEAHHSTVFTGLEAFGSPSLDCFYYCLGSIWKLITRLFSLLFGKHLEAHHSTVFTTVWKAFGSSLLDYLAVLSGFPHACFQIAK
jgi:hypothetical protein